MPIVNGVWYNYSLPCINANVTNSTNSSMSGIGCVLHSLTHPYLVTNVINATTGNVIGQTVYANIPLFWAIILILWYFSMAMFMVYDPQRSKTVIIGLSGMIFASILEGYGLIGPVMFIASLAVFVLTLFLYLLLGER